MGKLEELREYVKNYSNAPTLERMPRRTLKNKGIEGPTGAHIIEEIHTPFNFEYITITTGTTAFQNIVGVTAPEFPDRIKASHKALELTGVKPASGEKILFTYPPLVNVFTNKALELYGITTLFLKASSRDAFLLTLCKQQPRFVIGESSFLRLALEDAKKMGLLKLMPKGTVFITAGTPLDLELIDTAKNLVNGTVHDLYGCQEFGWLALDGIPLREDITLIYDKDVERYDLIVGGLPTGDSFPVLESGHVCNPKGKIITYSRHRSGAEHECTVLAATVSGRETVQRLARGVMRIKAKIVRVSPDIILNADHTILSLSRFGKSESVVIEGKTDLFDALLKAQIDYQQKKKTDPTWIKRR